MMNTYDLHCLDNRLKAKRRLASLLPQAEQRLAELGSLQASFSASGATVMRHVQIRRLDGVYIYRDGDGWRYGLIYRNMPPSIP